MDIWRNDGDAWTAINRLLDEALERPAGERDLWLDTLPAEYEPLKMRLRALLAHSARIETGDFMGTLPKLDLDVEEMARAEQAGALVGPYRLVREIGSGGMGCGVAGGEGGRSDQPASGLETSTRGLAPRRACRAHGARARDSRGAGARQHRASV